MHEYSEMYTLIHLLDAVSEIDVVGGKQQQRWGCGGGVSCGSRSLRPVEAA